MKLTVVYATKSSFKQHELDEWLAHARTPDDRPISQAVRFDVRTIDVKEVLDVDLEVIVAKEVRDAYAQLRVPCIVEHAGLVFEHRSGQNYPGGLTKPMWNALGDQFIEETRSAGLRAVARAVIGYCDGTSVRCFVGETSGTIAEAPRGSREFYWDTIFIPDVAESVLEGLTYAEIVDSPEYGLPYKVVELSQSFKAMRAFLDYRQANEPPLWVSRFG